MCWWEQKYVCSQQTGHESDANRRVYSWLDSCLTQRSWFNLWGPIYQGSDRQGCVRLYLWWTGFVLLWLLAFPVLCDGAVPRPQFDRTVFENVSETDTYDLFGLMDGSVSWVRRRRCGSDSSFCSTSICRETQQSTKRGWAAPLRKNRNHSLLEHWFWAEIKWTSKIKGVWPDGYGRKKMDGGETGPSSAVMEYEPTAELKLWGFMECKHLFL